MREPFEVDRATPRSSSRARAAARGRSARAPAIGGASYWADAAFIAAAGHPDRAVRPGRRGRPRRRGVGQRRRHRGRRAHAHRRRGAVLRVSGAASTPPSDPARRAGRRAPRRSRFHRALPGYRADAAPRAADGRRELASARWRQGRVRPPRPAGVQGARRVLGGRAGAARARPTTHTLVAASAGNHGRAVAHVAARRGLRGAHLPPARGRCRAARGDRRRGRRGRRRRRRLRGGRRPRRRPDGARAGRRSSSPTSATRGPADWVIDGYATLFAEAAEQATLRPASSCPSASARSPRPRRASAPRPGARRDRRRAGHRRLPDRVARRRARRPRSRHPGTTMAGLDCAEVSPAAWPSLRDGIHGDRHGHRRRGGRRDARARAGRPRHRRVRRRSLAALRQLDLPPGRRVLLVATEGPTGRA